MINWKLEGYKVGDEVCIINKVGIYTVKDKFIVGKVIHAGTKILKVTIPLGDKETVLIFNGRRSCNGVSFGDYYLVYKTIKEYKQVITEREKVENLKVYITRSLNDLPLHLLKEITDMIDVYKIEKESK